MTVPCSQDQNSHSSSSRARLPLLQVAKLPLKGIEMATLDDIDAKLSQTHDSSAAHLATSLHFGNGLADPKRSLWGLCSSAPTGSRCSLEAVGI